MLVFLEELLDFFNLDPIPLDAFSLFSQVPLLKLA